MRFLKLKCVILISITMVVIMSAAGFSEAAAKRSASSRKRTTPAKPAASQRANNSAVKRTPVPVDSDDIIAEDMLKLAEALRKTSQLDKGISTAQESRDRRIAQYDAEIEQVNAEIENLTLRIEQLEQKILDIEDMKIVVEESEISDDLKIDEEMEVVQDDIDAIEDRLLFSFDVVTDGIYPFSPKATSQVVEWKMTQDDETEVEKLSLTILHNRKTQRLTHLNVPSDLTESGDIFFKIDNLPEGVQIVIPKDNSNLWTVITDGRVGNKKFDNKGYFAAKIKNADDIAYSELDGDSNITEDGNKRFTSGEAIIILRKSSITIYPTEQKH